MTGTQNSVHILSAPAPQPMWAAAGAIAGTGDFNADKMSDILWRNSNGDVAIWLMNGTTVLANPDFVNVGASWTIQGTNSD